LVTTLPGFDAASRQNAGRFLLIPFQAGVLMEFALVVVISILTLSIAASLLRTRRAARSATRSARSRRR